MTKKDYIIIAKVLKKQEPEDKMSPEHLNWYRICTGLADEMKLDNSRFDYGKFMRACSGNEA